MIADSGEKVSFAILRFDVILCFDFVELGFVCCACRFGIGVGVRRSRGGGENVYGLQLCGEWRDRHFA